MGRMECVWNLERRKGREGEEIYDPPFPRSHVSRSFVSRSRDGPSNLCHDHLENYETISLSRTRGELFFRRVAACRNLAFSGKCFPLIFIIRASIIFSFITTKFFKPSFLLLLANFFLCILRILNL